MNGGDGRDADAGRGWLRDAWWACSAPLGFFGHLADRPHPRWWSAAGTAAAAWALALVVGALAFVRATQSDGVWLVAGLGALALAPVALLVSVLGALMLLGPGGLGPRAWEVVGWAWAPAGALALALLPAVLLAPALAAAAGVLAFPVWHLALVRAALAAHGARGRVRTVLLYALAVFLVPGTMAALALLAAAGAAG